MYFIVGFHVRNKLHGMTAAFNALLVDMRKIFAFVYLRCQRVPRECAADSDTLLIGFSRLLRSILMLYPSMPSQPRVIWPVLAISFIISTAISAGIATGVPVLD